MATAGPFVAQPRLRQQQKSSSRRAAAGGQQHRQSSIIGQRKTRSKAESARRVLVALQGAGLVHCLRGVDQEHQLLPAGLKLLLLFLEKGLGRRIAGGLQRGLGRVCNLQPQPLQAEQLWLAVSSEKAGGAGHVVQDSSSQVRTGGQLVRGSRGVAQLRCVPASACPLV